MISSRRFTQCLVGLMLCFFATLAYGDAVEYRFSGTSLFDNLPVAFEYISPTGFITTETELLESQLVYCLNCIGDPNIPSVIFSFENDGDQIQFNDVNNVGSAFTFPFDSFDTFGTYQSFDNPGHLTVSPVNNTAEPTSLLLLGGGLIMLRKIVHKRSSTQ